MDQSDDSAAYLRKLAANVRISGPSTDADRLDAIATGLTEQQVVFAELYQVIGFLANHAGVFQHPDVERALDNASRGRLVHKDLLPWPREPLPHAAELERTRQERDEARAAFQEGEVRLLAAAQRNLSLRAALAPFAKMARRLRCDERPEEDGVDVVMSVKALRRAAELVPEETQ